MVWGVGMEKGLPLGTEPETHPDTSRPGYSAETDAQPSASTPNTTPEGSEEQLDAVMEGDANEPSVVSSVDVIAVSGPITEPIKQAYVERPGSAEYGLSGEQVEELIRVIKQLKKSCVSKKVCASDPMQPFHVNLQPPL